jgi:hypothetical protein
VARGNREFVAPVVCGPVGSQLVFSFLFAFWLFECEMWAVEADWVERRDLAAFRARRTRSRSVVIWAESESSNCSFAFSGSVPTWCHQSWL